MRFFPYESYRLATKLTDEEIVNRLDGQLEPKDFFRLSIRGHRPFEGRIISNKFIIEMIGHRNSFRPKITGIILNDINGSIVSIRMRMAIVTYLFMTIWLGGVAVSGIRLLSEAFFKRQFDSTIFFILLMFAFGYGLMIYGFKSESLKSKRFLDELFEGSEIIQ